MPIDVILKYALLIVSGFLIVTILLQQRGGGVSSVFGGSGDSGLYRSRRGFEAFLYNATIVLGIVFSILSLAIALVNV
jgi:protein translocase SecG subunit